MIGEIKFWLAVQTRMFEAPDYPNDPKLTPRQYIILAMASINANGVGFDECAEQLQIMVPSLSRSVKVLADQGLLNLENDMSAYRRKRIMVTPGGLAFLKKLSDVIKVCKREML